MEFEWDKRKAATNLAVHDVSFKEAETVFFDSFAIISYDENHSENEIREIITGFSRRGRLLTVIFTERGNSTRIISARKSTKDEAKDYERTNK